MKTNRIYSFLGILLILTLFSGKAWGDALTTAELNFGTADISEDFNSCTGTKKQGSGSGAWSGEISNYGAFTNGYVGKSASVSFELATAANPMTSKHLKLVSLSNGTGISFSRSFATKGAYSFTMNKEALVTVGLNSSAVNGNMDTKANCSVMLKTNGGNILVHTGANGSWVSKCTVPTTTDLVTIIVVYNTTDQDATYGNSVSLPAKTAHLFINGTRVESGGSVVACSLANCASPAHFWLASNQSGTMLLDDVQIWDNLPTAAGDAITLNKNNSDASGSANGSGTIAANATSLTSGFTAPTRTGYEVEGYYTTSACTTKIATAAGALQSNVIVDAVTWTNGSSQWKKGGAATFYAKWDAKTYAITLNQNGATTSSAPTSVNATYKSSTLSSAITNPEKTDYIFDGWYSGAGGTGSLVISTAGVLQSDVTGYTDASGNWIATEGKNLYAKWTEHTYTNYRTVCCTPIATVSGKISIGSINETGGTASWSWSGATTGISKNILKIYNTSDELVKTIDNISASATSQSISGLTPCNTYYATLTTVATGAPYCEGEEQGKSDNFTTNGWAVHYTGGDETEGALLSNVTKQTGASQACLSEDYVSTFTANTGYKLPDNIIVYIASSEVTAGDDYTWSISNGTGTLTVYTSELSEEIDVRIIGECVAPAFTVHPASKTDYLTTDSPTPLGYTASAAGASLTQQWQVSDDNSNWSNIGGATSTTYTPVISSAGTKYYRVVVTNGTCGTSANSNVATITSVAPSVCLTPTFSVDEGTYTSSQSVTLSCATPGATIHYTTDGTTPDGSSPTYSSAIAVASTTTIKAIAVKDGLVNSPVASATYTIQCATPTFSVAAGTYTSSQTVTISTTYGTSIYYTTNGSEPTTGSTLYNGAITVSTTQTVKAIAVKDGCTNSAVGSAAYTIQCATPTFSPAAGTYNANQSVTLSTTYGAKIYYTTDGTNPTTESTEHSGAISVTQTTTIKAIAWTSGCTSSAIASATYTMKCATPTFSVAAGTYTGNQSVEISCTTPGVTIHYTTDGSTPDGSSPTYSSAIAVNSTQTIKAIAMKSNWTTSDMATAAYTIKHNVTWKVNGETYSTGVVDGNSLVIHGSKISAMATAPADNTLSSCASKFMGWSCKNFGSTPKTTASGQYDDLFTTTGGSPYITQDTTFYAVFAEREDTRDEGYYVVRGGVALTAGKTYVFGAVKASAASDLADNTTFGAVAFTNTYNSSTPNWGQRVDLTPSTSGYIAPDNASLTDDCKWTLISISSGNHTFKKGNNYLYLGSSEGSTSSAQSGVSTTSGNCYLVSFHASCKDAYRLYNNSAHNGMMMLYNTSFGYRMYEYDRSTSGSMTPNVRFYEYDPGYVYINYRTQCDPNIVKVTYNANSGTTSCANGEHDKRNDYTVCSSAPTRDYYSFTGWLCSADGGVYQANETINADDIDDDFTLTAQWSPVPYSITYNLNGGTNAADPIISYNVETVSALPTPTYDHKRFDGWYTDNNVWSNQVASITAGMHGNLTLYAKWTARNTIIFEVDGAQTTIYRANDENLEDAVAGQGSKPVNPAPPTACSEKVFVGWSASEIDDETDTRPGDLTNATGTVNTDKHYYAVWAIQSGTPIAAVEDNSFTTSGIESYCGMTNGMKDVGDYILKNSIWTSSNMSGVQVKIKVYHLSNSSSDVLRISLVNSSGTEVVGTDLTTTARGSNSSSAAYSSYVTLTPTSTVTGYKVALKTKNSNGSCVDKVTREVVAIYSKYSTSCCATKVTLSHNSPEHGTIAFGKTTVPTCGGDKDVSLTITPAAGYQLATYSVATGSGKVATKTDPGVSLNNNSSAAQNLTLTFAEDANGAYDVTASFTLMTVTSWTWTYNSAAIPDPLNLYVGQSARLDVAYTPSGVDATKKTYERDKDDAYINWVAGKQPTYSTISGKASTGENTTEVTFTHADGPTKTVNVKVLPLPLTHFEDLVHGKSFDDVVATIADNALSATKTTPTSDDWTTPNANTCEENHLHLVGWIRSDWPALVSYLNGTGDAPTTVAITGAGNDGSGNAYYIAAGASINVQTFDGVTFYAVWAKVE